MKHSLALSLLTLAIPSLASADVHVVDSGGTGEFLSVADAVAQASDGDVVLIRPGAYAGPVTIDGLALHLVADATGSVSISEPLEVRDTMPGQSVVLSGIELLDGFYFHDCDGPIQVQDCTAPRNTMGLAPTSGIGWGSFPLCGIGESTQRVIDCRSAIFTACAFDGENGLFVWPDGSPGHHALIVERADVLLYDTVLRGGDGIDSVSFTHGSTGGAGGDGLHIEGPASTVTHEGLDAAGGIGGANSGWSTPFACAGEMIRGAGAIALVRPPVAFDAPVILHGRAAGRFTVVGPAGATVGICSAQVPSWRPLGTTTGNLTVGNPLRITVHGPIPASGVLDVDLNAFDPATTDDSISLYYQALILTSGPRVLSEPRSVVVLHPSL